ncbi:MAG: DUF2846 domain-containing protein [Terriglobia bacterium]
MLLAETVDSLAWQFVAAPPPAAGNALVYIYRQSNIVGMAGYPTLYVNGRLVAYLHNGTYAPVEEPQGVVTLSTYRAGSERLRIEVEAGKTYYVKWSIGDKMKLEDSMTGEKEIMRLHPTQIATQAVPVSRQTTPIQSEVSFSGDLQMVTQVSVSIRLADGRVIDARNIATDGDLAPRTLSDRYTVGDQVEIACAPINGVYYPALRLYLHLELRELRSVRAPSDDERQKAMASRVWRSACLSPTGTPVRCNLLRSSAPPPPAPVGSLLRDLPLPTRNDDAPATPTQVRSSRLDLIRSRALSFAATMPNFVADEVASRYYSAASPPNWRLVDTLQDEITFKGSQESRDHITLSGKPWNLPYEMLPGSHWQGGFGSELPALFDPNCPTKFELEGRITEAGKNFSSIRFSSPPDGCVAVFTSGYQRYFAGQTGRILLDEQEENVLRIEARSEGFPRAFPMSASEEQVAWGQVKIGDEAHLLPVSADFITVDNAGAMHLIRNEYKNHRHFEAASTITFH